MLRKSRCGWREISKAKICCTIIPPVNQESQKGLAPSAGPRALRRAAKHLNVSLSEYRVSTPTAINPVVYHRIDMWFTFSKCNRDADIGEWDFISVRI